MVMIFNRSRFVAAQFRRQRAITLIEVIMAMVVLVVAALGALSYQYHAVGHARIGRALMVGTRTAQLLIEDWKSTGGSTDYDPSTLGLGFSTQLFVPSHWVPDEAEEHSVGVGTPLSDSVYAVTVDGLPMVALLSSEDVSVDATAGVTLRQLSVIVNFGQPGEPAELKEWVECVAPVTLITYVRVDSAGG